MTHGLLEWICASTESWNDGIPGVVLGWFSLATDEAVTTLELSLVYMAELT